MAVCPNCHTKDKNFFAGQCHACNSQIGFIEQCIISLVWTVTEVAVVVGIIWLLFKLIG